MKEFLDDTDLFIKDNLDSILAGEYDNKFSKEQLDKMIELSFLYNHLTIEDGKIIFNYANQKINFINVMDTWVNGFGSVEMAKNMIVNAITSTDDFKSSFKSFLRDRKISKIIN